LTITTSQNAATFPGNGTQTVFDFDFIAGDPSYVTVTTVVGGVSTVLVPSAYTLDINPALPGSIWGVGGSVTYPLTGSPLAVGSTLTVERTVPELQTVSLSNQGSQTPQSTEMGLDLLEMQIQQASTANAYAFTAPITDSSPPLPAPPASARANQGAIFDGAGNLTAGALPSSGVISTAMQPVVDAATLALGRTAFGLGALAVENFGAGLGSDGAGNARVNQTVTVDASNEAVTAAFAWNLRVASAAITYTSPAGSTLWNGFTVSFDALGGAITLAIASNDSFAGQASGAPFAIAEGSAAVVTCDGETNATWYVRVSSAGSVGTAASPGDVKMTAANTVPAGWLQNNGQAVSRTTFAALFDAIGTSYGSGDGSTTFNVPNDQGYFWRSWNGTGSGIDPSRTFGSVQADAMQTHQHNVAAGSNSELSAGADNVPTVFGGPLATTGNTGRTASETRPSNIAYLSVIKY
jgi:microcystin-dependent protein